MKIAIVGAGMTGLSAGLALAPRHRVTIFEKESAPGGLARTFRQSGWRWPLEVYPHHLFTSDDNAIRLIRKLGLGSKIRHTHGRSAYFTGRGLFRLDSPATLLSTPSLTWNQKARVGLAIFKAKTASNWRSLEEETAWEWASNVFGQAGATLLWHPLLEKKFGPYAKQVNAAWLWGRIKKRSQTLLYLEGSFDVLVQAMIESIRKHQGKIITSHPVRSLKPLQKKFDRILVTVPTPIFSQLAREFAPTPRFQADFPPHLASLCFTLSLKHSLLPNRVYWLNITDPTIPFVFLDEHTHLIDQAPYGGQTVVYLGGYYLPDHPFARQKPTQLLRSLLPHLAKINPRFRPDWILAKHFATDRYAQPIFPPGSSRSLPPFATGIRNVFLSNFDQVYPWDRGVNYAIQAGIQAAEKLA